MIRGEQKGFSPIVPKNCKALLLGSYPSPKSFDASFYYGHPRNRFWPLVAALSGSTVPQDTAARRLFIENSCLALWDMLESCAIKGAADSSITKPTPNNIAQLVHTHGINTIFCNGRASWQLYQRFALPQTNIKAHYLPSTSPANAACTFEQLLCEWQPVAPFLATKIDNSPVVAQP